MTVAEIKESPYGDIVWCEWTGPSGLLRLAGFQSRVLDVMARES